ncbi:hypothetical protein RHMOL_Rhmol12G0004900 [Rhododendron molle]|uniref:Uncharacterized protein n=1 Tax=Rhododendron molle TaxID=49168 RepID=A0ACC0LD95_RHOML|nr:hypothetical protein RHMOL_Rhmol12G0004900 [Rhododendron molle]
MGQMGVWGGGGWGELVMEEREENSQIYDREKEIKYPLGEKFLPSCCCNSRGGGGGAAATSGRQRSLKDDLLANYILTANLISKINAP